MAHKLKKSPNRCDFYRIKLGLLLTSGYFSVGGGKALTKYCFLYEELRSHSTMNFFGIIAPPSWGMGLKRILNVELLLSITSIISDLLELKYFKSCLFVVH